MAALSSNPLEPRRRIIAWEFQAFSFALDLTAAQREAFLRNAGARRVAFNWAIARLDQVIAGDPAAPGIEMMQLARLWEAERDLVAVNTVTGQRWWPDVSPWAVQDGLRGALTGVDRWRRSQAGGIAGEPQNFPRPRGRKKSRQRFRVPVRNVKFSTDHRTIHMPVLGVCRSFQNTRALVRLLNSRRLQLFSLVLKAQGKRIIAVFNCKALRPHLQRIHTTTSVIGVDVGIRMLATVANADGTYVRQFENPRPLERILADIQQLDRQLSRQVPGSHRYHQTRERLSRSYQRAAAVRDAAIHELTRFLATNFSVVVIEDLQVKDLLDSDRPGFGRKFRRSLADSALGLIGRYLRYKCRWYGSYLIVADRYFPSSRLCHACRHVNESSPERSWPCAGCGRVFDRDVNAAINLARYAIGFRNASVSPPP